MSGIANQALQKLLERGERSALKESSRAITLNFTQASFPEYLNLSFADKQALHGVLREAKRAGAIEIEWDVLAGDNGQITRISLSSVESLANHLGRTTHAQWLAGARQLLSPWSGNARVQEVLDAWSQMRLVRGRRVEEAADLADALKVLEHCRQERDTSVRALSAKLFNSSKRLEALEVWLDILTDQELQGSRRSAAEVFAALGLIKHPPAIHLAGAAQLSLIDDSKLQVPTPFVALAPSSIRSIHLDESVRTILSVENLTIFHEIADGRAGALTGYLLLYTAGMPAPSFMRLYRQLLAACGARGLYHWGDIDPAGFRIAACLARAAKESEKSLKLWQMRADQFPPERAWRKLAESELTEMRRICEQYGWNDEAQSIQQSNLSFEQEGLPLALPGRPNPLAGGM